MDALERIGKSGLVPVAVFNNEEDAVFTSKALVDGGLDIIEITLRTQAGLKAIKNVAKQFPEMLVGAGTVLSLDDCKRAVDSGARFIVTPGFNDNIVEWCLSNNLPITPGCVTPTEIGKALSYGIRVVKFFPAATYGGVEGCKSLYGPFRAKGISFIPTGGVDNNNLVDFVNKNYIHAIGGSWLCSSSDIEKKLGENITNTVKIAIQILLGLKLKYIVIDRDINQKTKTLINCLNQVILNNSTETHKQNELSDTLQFDEKVENGSTISLIFSSNNLKRSIHYFQKFGVSLDNIIVNDEVNKEIRVNLIH